MLTYLKQNAPYLAVLLWFAGCASPRMVPPDDIAKGSKVLEVQNRSRASGLFVNEGFDLGSYKVSHVDRNATSQSSFSVSAFKSSDTKTGYSYELSNGETKWIGSCSFTENEKGMAFGGGEFMFAKANISCDCKSGDKNNHLEIKREGEKLTATATLTGNNYTLMPIDKTNPKTYAAAPVGYRMDAATGAVAAVEVLYPGRIWFTDKLVADDQMPAACLLTGMMLYVEPKDKSE